jgi:hypothetical protein
MSTVLAVDPTIVTVTYADGRVVQLELEASGPETAPEKFPDRYSYPIGYPGHGVGGTTLFVRSSLVQEIPDTGPQEPS